MQATVIGTSILSNDPSEYTTKAFAISGSCKMESVEDQERLIRSASSAVHDTLQNGLRLYCIASDGDSRRRRALISITLPRELNPSSKIYELLSPLLLFNLRCGENDVTCDFDWKHVFKRFRNTLLRQKGIEIDNVSISTSAIKAHLVSNGISSLMAEVLLDPNDKQDVVLMVKLLHAIAVLPLPNPDVQPLTKATRRILRLLGHIYANLLKAYLDVNLSLNDQLSHLSTAAHLILAIYNQDKGNFIPVQTCFDVMSMIKNVFFSVAKTQVDNPDGLFWIILLGTDGLEKVFGKVRTMVGNDTHADQFQLTNRIDGAVQCVNILENHPEWGGQSRRLNLKPLPGDVNEISANNNHINPKSWKGDVHVSNVVLSACWSSGRRSTESVLRESQISPPFEKMIQTGGYDILSPFGQSKMMLVDGTLFAGEEEETEEERDLGSSANAVPQSSSEQQTNLPDNPPSKATHAAVPESSSDEDLELDFDDATSITDARNFSSKAPYDPWVLVDGKKVHKATVLRLYSNPLAASDSKDRLKRVRGFSQYNETVMGVPSATGQISSESSDSSQAGNPNEVDDVVCIQDPALTLVRCNKKVFLAVFQILGIRIDNKSVQSLPVTHIHEPNVRINGQIMKLGILNNSHQPDATDWEWNGSFEARATFQNVEGNWVELINPVVQRASRGRNSGQDTYVFRTAELRAIAALLQERIDSDFHRLPGVSQSPSFPYRS